jgi:hypothetical protein
MCCGLITAQPDITPFLDYFWFDHPTTEDRAQKHTSRCLYPYDTPEGLKHLGARVKKLSHFRMQMGWRQILCLWGLVLFALLTYVPSK